MSNNQWGFLLITFLSYIHWLCFVLTTHSFFANKTKNESNTPNLTVFDLSLLRSLSDLSAMRSLVLTPKVTAVLNCLWWMGHYVLSVLFQHKLQGIEEMAQFCNLSFGPAHFHSISRRLADGSALKPFCRNEICFFDEALFAMTSNKTLFFLIKGYNLA